MNGNDDEWFDMWTDPSFALPSKAIEALGGAKEEEEEEERYGDVALCHQQTKELLLSSAQTQGVCKHKPQPTNQPTNNMIPVNSSWPLFQGSYRANWS